MCRRFRENGLFYFLGGIFKFLQELEQRFRDEVATAKEEAEKNVDLLNTAKEMIAGENGINFALKSVFI